MPARKMPVRLSNEELTSIFERIIDKMSDHQVARLKTGRS